MPLMLAVSGPLTVRTIPAAFRTSARLPILADPGTHEMAHHVQDYGSFTKLFKYGAAVCLIVGLVWLLIIKAYW